MCFFSGDESLSLTVYCICCAQYETGWLLCPPWVSVRQPAGVHLQDRVPQPALQTLWGGVKEKTGNLLQWQAGWETYTLTSVEWNSQGWLHWHLFSFQTGVQSEEGGLGWWRLQGGGLSKGPRRAGTAETWREEPQRDHWRWFTQELQ